MANVGAVAHSSRIVIHSEQCAGAFLFVRHNKLYAVKFPLYATCCIPHVAYNGSFKSFFAILMELLSMTDLV
jgi:hypothetical protein